MTDRTVAELYDALLTAAEEGDVDRVARLGRRIQESDDSLTDLLEQFETALENREDDKARTLVGKIKRRYAEIRVEDRAMSERVTHARDTADLSREERERVTSFLDVDLATAMERVAFIADATAFLGQPDAGDREQVIDSAASLRERETALDREHEQVSGVVEGLTLPPALDVVTVDTGEPNPPGEPFPVTVTVANLGDVPAEGVRASVEPGDGLSVVDAPGDVGRINGGNRRQTTASLRADASGTVAFEVRVRADNGAAAAERALVEIEADATVERGNGDGGMDWLPIAGGIGALGLGAGTLELVRRRRGGGGERTGSSGDRTDGGP